MKGASTFPVPCHCPTWPAFNRHPWPGFLCLPNQGWQFALWLLISYPMLISTGWSRNPDKQCSHLCWSGNAACCPFCEWLAAACVWHAHPSHAGQHAWTVPQGCTNGICGGTNAPYCSHKWDHHSLQVFCHVWWSPPPPLLQDQRKGGRISLTVHACTATPSQMASINHFISLKTTPPCPADSRAWRSSSRSVVCGPKECQISFPSAQVFVASLATLTAAADAFSLYSPISFLKSHSFKSWSSFVATYATSTQNTTVNWILSNNTGGRQSFAFRRQGIRQQSWRWRG